MAGTIVVVNFAADDAVFTTRQDVAHVTVTAIGEWALDVTSTVAVHLVIIVIVVVVIIFIITVGGVGGIWSVS